MELIPLVPVVGQGWSEKLDQDVEEEDHPASSTGEGKGGPDMEAIPPVRSSLSGSLLVVVKLSALVRRGLEVGGLASILLPMLGGTHSEFSVYDSV